MPHSCLRGMGVAEAEREECVMINDAESLNAHMSATKSDYLGLWHTVILLKQRNE